jgi:hypothetical protein
MDESPPSKLQRRRYPCGRVPSPTVPAGTGRMVLTISSLIQPILFLPPCLSICQTCPIVFSVQCLHHTTLACAPSSKKIYHAYFACFTYSPLPAAASEIASSAGRVRSLSWHLSLTLSAKHTRKIGEAEYCTESVLEQWLTWQSWYREAAQK